MLQPSVVNLPVTKLCCISGKSCIYLCYNQFIELQLTCARNRGSISRSSCSRTWVPVDSKTSTGIARNAKGMSIVTWIS